MDTFGSNLCVQDPNLIHRTVCVHTHPVTNPDSEVTLSLSSILIFPWSTTTVIFSPTPNLYNQNPKIRTSYNLQFASQTLTMLPHCLEASHHPILFRPILGLRHPKPSPALNSLILLSHKTFPSIFCSFNGGKRRPRGEGKKKKKNNGERLKENVWSVDNELARVSVAENTSGRRKGGRRVKNVRKRNENSRVIVSKAMLMETETVLQTQEPVLIPSWNTFASSVSGIWTGVGAVFSPFTAEMEPIGIGNQNENLYDCYTRSRVEQVVPHSEGLSSQIRRKITWVVLNPYGETLQLARNGERNEEQKVGDFSSLNRSDTGRKLPSFESFDFQKSEVLEEDFMGMEPGLVFFEDGSYSRGPVDIPVGEFDEAKYFISPTFKFEQCLVKGCHKRLRIVHTIEFNGGGSDIQIVRVAVYEEQWVSPSNVVDQSDMDFDLKPFSQRRRIQPSELTGSWKVFEVSATPIFGETLDEGRPPYVYLCMETLKKRSWPENPVYFGEEEMLDMQDVAVLWLPGGVTGYVDVKKDGTLCIGVGWYSDEGINLVMERDYGIDGKLKEVRSKSEVKRRWSDPLPV
ncbi:uncharacterized protein LOC143879142 [Tasmannia lanceolata]|uniref:uncharacterized protein LOC143879142 n=1 Tax=Tasmannia lanceolata TaxID=3420 RepID=UPI004062A690